MNSDAGCNASKKAFSCSECGKQFLDEQSLRRHMRRNTEKNSSDCSRCSSALSLGIC
uniref:C2H2-type domain-containing protein n=1 Tax=Xiphophorus maculatus TaxID=8083 RepID=A0A3B5QS72_XIPMA